MEVVTKVTSMDLPDAGESSSWIMSNDDNGANNDTTENIDRDGTKEESDNVDSATTPKHEESSSPSSSNPTHTNNTNIDRTKLTPKELKRLEESWKTS